MPVSGEEPITSFFPRLGASRKRKENALPLRLTKKRKPAHLQIYAAANEPPNKKAKVMDTAVHRDAANGGNQLRPKDGNVALAFDEGLFREPSLDQSSNLGCSRKRTLTLPDCYSSSLELENQDNSAIPHTSSTALEDTHSPGIMKRKGLISMMQRPFSDAFFEPSLQTTPATKRPDQKRMRFSSIIASQASPLVLPADPCHAHTPRNRATFLPTPETLVRHPDVRPSSALALLPVRPSKSPDIRTAASNVTPMPSATLIGPAGASKFHPRNYVAEEGSPSSMLIPREQSDIQEITDEESDAYSTGNPFSLPRLSHAVVPSSQTLDVRFEYPHNADSSSPDPPIGRMIYSPVSTLPALHVHGRKSFMHDNREPNGHDARPLRNSDHQSVPSSQSQYLVLHDRSSRQSQSQRWPKLSLGNSRSVAVDEVVSTSQSQIEKELDISMSILPLSPIKHDILGSPLAYATCGSNFSTNQEQFGHGRRHTPSFTTLLQSSFDVRSTEKEVHPLTRKSVFIDLFEQGSNAVIEPEGRAIPSESQSANLLRVTTTSNSPTNDLDDSATESDGESDDIGSVAPSGKLQIPVSEDTSRHKSHFRDYAHDHQIPGASYSDNEILGGAPNIPNDLAAGLESINNTESGWSLESLPQVVKEFRDMFGSGEGSYPDSFPMSLR